MNYALNNQARLSISYGVIIECWVTLGYTCSHLFSVNRSRSFYIWDHISDHHTHAQETGAWSKRRSQQQIRWMWSMVEDQLIHNLRNEASIAQTVSETEEQVLNGDLSATEAAKRYSLYLKSHHKRSSSPMLSLGLGLIPVGGLEN